MDLCTACEVSAGELLGECAFETPLMGRSGTLSWYNASAWESWTRWFLLQCQSSEAVQHLIHATGVPLDD